MLEKIEQMLERVEGHPDPDVRETARELVRELLDFHREGVSRMMELAENRPPGLMAPTGMSRRMP